MAIKWGSWSSNGRLRCGIEMSMSPSTVGTGTTQVTITTKVYLQTYYASNETGSSTNWWISGDVSASGNTDWNLGGSGTILMGTDTQTFNTSYSSSQSIDATGRIHSYYAYPGTEATVSQSITIPKRPYSDPEDPTSVTGTRINDNSATVAWTRHASAGAPVTSITVERQTQTGDTWGSWQGVTTISGSWTSDGSMSYTATGLSANHKYSFRVRANNSSGSSNSVEQGNNDIYMTPGAPSSATAAKDPSGTSITVSWVPTAYISGTVTHQIERSVNGGAYASVVTGIAQGTNTWQDPSPGAGTNTYKVYARTSEGPLVSAGTESNTVSTTVAPLAPTLLSPNGIAVDLGSVGVTLTWQHNHGGDGAAQSHYTIETSANGGSTWQPLATDIASSTSSRVVAAGVLSNGVNYLWRVKTEGVVSVGFGPFSANASLTGSAKPVATLTANYPPATLNTLPLEARWTYAQDQGSPQAEYEAQLLAGDGTTILETVAGSGTDGAAIFAYPLANGSNYVVRVRVKSGAGLWGDYDSQAVAFALLPPADSDVTPTYDECTGTMVLDITADAPVGGVTVAVASVTIERRVAGGDWVTVATGVPVPSTILDVTPLTKGVNEYRLTSVSASPSYSVMAPVSVTATDGVPGAGQWAFLSYGDSFQNILRVHADLQVTDTTARVRDAQPLLGRTKSGLLVGDNTTWVVKVSAALHYDYPGCFVDPDNCDLDSPPVDWRDASRQAEIVLFRDYTGRRLFGKLSAVDVTEKALGHATVAFDVEETDFTETPGTVVV